MSKLTLFINKQQVAFESATLSFSLEQLAHTVSATVSGISVDEPLPVKLKLGSTVIFSGLIDGVSDAVSSNGDKISISGRSLSANLIDSRIKVDAIYEQRLDQLLEAVVADFGLSVQSNVATALLPLVSAFQINAESPVANLAQIAKQQNLMLIEQNGVIEIERPGQFTEKNIQLKMGVNTQDISIQKSWAGQFYHYEVQGAWDDAEATVYNKDIAPCRKKIIIADKLQDAASCKTRAQYECNLGIAKGVNVSATLPGLYSALTGATLNKLLTVEKGDFKEDLLVKSISLSVSATAETTKVELFRPFGV